MTEDRFEQLAAQLRSPDPAERLQAIATLLELRERRAIDLMPPLVELEVVPDVRYHARRAYLLLREVLPEDPANPFVPLPDGISIDDLERLLVEDNPRLRIEGIRLAERVEPGTIAPVLRSALEQERLPELQVALLMAMGRVGAKYDIPTVAQFLSNPNPRLRITAIEALARIGGHDALENVVPLLQDHDKDVREAAAKPLQAVGTRELLEILQGMAKSPLEVMRAAAIHTLQRFKAPIAAKIMAYLATNDPLPALRDKARAGLEAMARSDKNARAVYDEMVLDERRARGEEIPSADGSVPAPPPEEMTVPGVPPKLVREMCKGDAAVREAGLRQLAAMLTPEHVPFLLHRLEVEEELRLTSYLLTLLGMTKARAAYAAVIKCFKHADDRVRANAIAAAQSIDPETTPDRVVGFLKDPNNRVRANSILVCASRPDFDPLVFVRDLAGHREPAWRRSALYVINQLKRDSFLEILQFLIDDCEMEIRQLAFIALTDYVKREVKGAREIGEEASRKLSREQRSSGKFDQDFHAAMNAMRAPPPPRRDKKKTDKSAGEELGEQLLGQDGLQKAGQTVKDLRKQAKQAGAKVAAAVGAVDWQERAPQIIKWLLLAVFIALHAFGTLRRLEVDAPIRLIYGGSALAALVFGLVTVRSRPGLGAMLAGLLLLVPIGAVQLGLEDPLAAPAGGGPAPGGPGGGAKTGAGTGARVGGGSAMPATSHHGGSGSGAGEGSGRGSAAGSGSPRVAATGKPSAPPPTIKILEPAKGATISGEFAIRAKVTGQLQDGRIMIDSTILANLDQPKPGIIEHTGIKSDAFPPGPHAVSVVVTDVWGRQAEEGARILFPAPLPDVRITSPVPDGVFWRDDRLAAVIDGADHDDVEFVLDDQPLFTFPPDPDGRYEYPLSIATMTEGPHRFEVRTRLPDARVASAVVQFRRLTPVPSVQFAAPKEGEEVFGLLHVRIQPDTGWKEVGLRQVMWFADGLHQGTLATPPFEATWDLTDETLGPHELKATIENELGATAETVRKITVIRPQFSVTVKGIKPGAVLDHDTVGTVAVVNEFPDTMIGKVVISIDDVPVQTATKAPWAFTLKIDAIAPGPRRLTVEAFRSDGKRTSASLPFSVAPPDRVGLYFTAMDSRGRMLATRELASIPLVIEEDGKRVGSLTLQAATAMPDQFGLVLHVAGVMKADRRLAKVKEGAVAFLDMMKREDRAFLVKFSDIAELVVDFTADRRKLQQEVEFLTPKGGTSLLNAVCMAIEHARRSTGRVALLVAVDLGAEQSAVDGRSLADTIELARLSDVQIYTVALGRSMPSAQADLDEQLRTLAQKTGGRHLAVATPKEVPGAFVAIGRELAGQTRAWFRSPSGASDGRWHLLKLSAPGRSDLVFTHKPGFQARAGR